MRYCLSCLVLLFCASLAVAQQTDVQALVTREFGKTFKVDAKAPQIFADLDGDGTEDAAIVTTSEHPLTDAIDFHYSVIDPYDSYFGFGDARVTVQFSATNVGPTRYLLVLHDWKKTPKAKFVIVNLPFDRLASGKVLVKKKTFTSIHAIEAGGLESDVYWDGKKYRWEPNYFSN